MKTSAVKLPGWVLDGPFRGSGSQQPKVDRFLGDALRAEGCPPSSDGEAARELVNRAYDHACARVVHELRESRPDALFVLMAAHDQMIDSAPVPAAGASIEERARDAFERVERTRAIRWLVEACCHVGSSGERPLSPARMGTILAFARKALICAMHSDAAWKELAEVRVELSAERGFRFEVAGLAPAASHSAAEHAGGQLGHDHTRTAELGAVGRVAEAELSAVGDAVVEGLGFPLGAIERLRTRVGETPGPTVRLEDAESIGALVAGPGIDAEAAGRFVRQFTLEPDPDFDPGKPAFQPQRAMRPNSYGRNVFVRAPDGRLAWSPNHVRLVGSDLLTRIVTNRLRWGQPVETACLRVSQRLDLDFNRRVARAAGRIEGWTVRRNVTRLAGRTLRSSEGPLGDIDVYAVHATRRLAVAIDTKRVAPSTGSYEMWREAQAFYKDGGYVDKHLRRCRWLEENVDAVAADAGRPGEASEPWVVRGILTTTLPLMGTHRERVKLPTLPFWDALTWLEDAAAVEAGDIKLRRLTELRAWTEL